MSNSLGSSIGNWVQKQKDRTSACRSCDMGVNVSETVCPRCGQSDPARVPMSAVTAVFGFAACVIIATFQFAY